MRAIKLFTVVTTLILISCNTGDDIARNTTPINQTITANIDVNNLLNSTGNDASAFANFGQPTSISNANFTTVALVGDKLIFKGIAQNSSNRRIIVKGISYVSGVNLLEEVLVEADNSNFGDNAYVYDVLDRAADGDEMKYQLLFTIETNGVEDPTVYFIDPKIRIKSFR